MSVYTRRQLLKTGSLAAIASAVPYNFVRADNLYLAVPRADGPELKTLVNAALNAATSAGAAYAEVHYRVVREEGWNSFYDAGNYQVPQRSTFVSLGVRSLVNGYWGFAGSDSIPSLDNAAKLGKDATAQAKTAATGKPRTAELAKAPPVTGSWVMPVERDPFTDVTFEEKVDFALATSDLFSRVEYATNGRLSAMFHKDERTFASSEGSYTTQTTYMTSGDFHFNTAPDILTDWPLGGTVDFLSPAGAGWEYIRNAPIRVRAQQLIDNIKTYAKYKPVDVGRYDVVFDSGAMAGMLDVSVGQATSLPRALGYDANDAGTSYLKDPFGMVGTFKVGSPLLTVTSNRSMPMGAATVKWDDEGVAPPEATLVKDGILNDYQTTRESASWLTEYYQKKGVPVQSNGCAFAYGGMMSPKLQCPNLVMQPGKSETSFADLVAGTKRGMAIRGALVNSDQQALNVNGYGQYVNEIVDGKLGIALSNVMFNYRGPEFWKNLVAVGGPSSARQFGFAETTGARGSGYRFGHSISAVPGKVVAVAITDSTRK